MVASTKRMAGRRLIASVAEVIFYLCLDSAAVSAVLLLADWLVPNMTAQLRDALWYLPRWAVEAPTFGVIVALAARVCGLLVAAWRLIRRSYWFALYEEAAGVRELLGEFERHGLPAPHVMHKAFAQWAPEDYLVAVVADPNLDETTRLYASVNYGMLAAGGDDFKRVILTKAILAYRGPEAMAVSSSRE